MISFCTPQNTPGHINHKGVGASLPGSVEHSAKLPCASTDGTPWGFMGTEQRPFNIAKGGRGLALP